MAVGGEGGGTLLEYIKNAIVHGVTRAQNRNIYFWSMSFTVRML